MRAKYMMNSMLGAFVGDAAGATLEFCHKPITERMAINAMRMPGGGRINVGPGQITDDGELTLAVWAALNERPNANLEHCLYNIMRHYAKWYNSLPFDIGQTCSMAFEQYTPIDAIKLQYTDSQISKMRKEVEEINYCSEANGALMRATAIATWIAMKESRTLEDGITLAKEDAKLSHPNIVCQEVNAIYIYAIIHLLRGISPVDTIRLLDEYISKNSISEKVRKWYFEESLDVSELNCQKMIGHVRYGFVLAIYFLRNPHISYEDAIKYTLMKGGDTDTNACIVGGLVGAYKTIPDFMKKPVIEFDCLVQEHNRPLEYSVKNFYHYNIATKV